MYPKQRTVVIVVSMVMVCCIIGLAAYQLSNPSDSGDHGISDDEYIGCWYLVQTVRSYNDGTIMDICVGDDDDIQLADRSINIYSVDDGLVHAAYRTEGITGYVAGDQVRLYMQKHGNYTCFSGYLKDDFMVLVNAHSDIDGDGNNVAICSGLSIYSKDPARPVMDVTGICPNLSGDWHLSFETALSSSTPIALTGLDLSIDWMKDGVFTGRIVANWSQSSSTIDVKGAMTPCENGFQGTMSDSMYGTNWSITYRDGEIRLGSTDSKLIGGMNGAVEICLTRDGTGHVANTPYANVLGTSWVATSSKEIDVHGNRSSDGNVYVLSFDEQKEDIVHGNSVYGTHDANAYFYYISDLGHGRFSMLASWDEFHDTATIGTGWYIDGKMHVIECYVDSNGAPITNVTILEPYSQVSEDDIIGHWYACYATGCNQDGKYVEMSYGDYPFMGMYDVDILTYDDGLIFGRFMGQNITAAYSNGFINTDIIQQEGQYVHTARGWFEGSIMVLVAGYTVSNGDGTFESSVYYVAYSKVREAIAINKPTSDISGTWFSDSYTKYDVSGQLTDLGEITLKVDMLRDNIFTGTLGKATIGGVYLDTAGNSFMGVVTDDLGMQWYFTGNDDVVYMNRISSNQYEVENVGSTCIKLTRGEHQPDVIVPDLSGKKYDVADLTFLYSDGDRYYVDYLNTLEITEQQGNCIIGKWNMEYCTFDVTGSIFWFGDTLVVRLSFQNGPDAFGIPLGYMTILHGNVVASMHTFEDVRYSSGSSPMVEVVP